MALNLERELTREIAKTPVTPTSAKSGFKQALIDKYVDKTLFAMYDKKLDLNQFSHKNIRQMVMEDSRLSMVVATSKQLTHTAQKMSEKVGKFDTAMTEIGAEFGSKGGLEKLQNIIKQEDRFDALIGSKKALVSERKSLIKEGKATPKEVAKLDKLNGKIADTDRKIKLQSARIDIAHGRNSDDVAKLKSELKCKNGRSDVVSKLRVSPEMRENAKFLTANVGNIESLRSSLFTANSEVERFGNKHKSDLDRITAKAKFKTHSAYRDKVSDSRKSYKLSQRPMRVNGGIKVPNKGEIKSAKTELKLAQAQEKLNAKNTKKVARVSYSYNEKTGEITKIKEKVTVPKALVDDRATAKTAQGMVANAALMANPWTHIKGSLNRSAADNDTLKLAMKGTRVIESGAKYAAKLHKEAPYRRVAKLQLKRDKGNAKIYADRKGGSFFDKQKLRKEYMKKAKEAKFAAVKKGGLSKAVAVVRDPIGSAGRALGKKLLAGKAVILVKGLAIIAIAVLIITLIIVLIAPFLRAGDAVVGLVSSYHSDERALRQAVCELRQIHDDKIDALLSGSYDVTTYNGGELPSKTQYCSPCVNCECSGCQAGSWTCAGAHYPLELDEHQLLSYLSAYWLIYVNNYTLVDEADENSVVNMADVEPFSFEEFGFFLSFFGTSPAEQARTVIRRFYDNVRTTQREIVQELVTIPYTAGTWSGGTDLIQVGDVLTVYNFPFSVSVLDEDGEVVLDDDGNAVTDDFIGDFYFNVIESNPLDDEGNFTGGYTVEVMPAPLNTAFNGTFEPMLADENPLTIYVSAYTLYMRYFERSREMSVNKITSNSQRNQASFYNWIHTAWSSGGGGGNEEICQAYQLMYAFKGNWEPGLFWSETRWNAYESTLEAEVETDCASCLALGF